MANQQMDLELRITSQTKDAVKSVDNLTAAVTDLRKESNKKSDGLISNLNDQVDDLASSITSQLGPVGSAIQSAITSPIGAATIAIGALAAEFNFLLNQSLAGEKLNSLETQFNNLAKTANITGDALKNALLVKADGLIDDTAAIELANRALVTLGNGAKNIPQLLDAARKATNLFGGSIEDNFQKMLFAVESGNTRVLRSIGIFINAEESNKKFATSIGTTAEQLSEAGKQQSILNTILDQANAKFSAGAESTTPLNDSLKRMKISLDNVIESLQKIFNAKYAAGFTVIFDAIASGLRKISGDENIKDVTSDLDDLTIRYSQAANQLKILKEQLDQARADDPTGMKTSLLTSQYATQKNIVAGLESQLDLLLQKEKELTAQQEQSITTTDKSTQSFVRQAAATQNLIDKNTEFVNFLKQFNGDENLTLNAAPLIDPNFFKQSTEKVKEDAQSMADFLSTKAEEIRVSFASGLADGLLDFADGTKSAAQAFEDFARSFLRQIAKMILQQAILNSLKSAGGFGFSEGGPVQAFASGGYVSGPGTSTSDSIPARLSDGEFVMKAKAVKKLGLGFLNGLNNIGSHGIPTRARAGNGFAEGGLVTSAAQAPQVIIQNQGTQKQAVSQETDPSTGVTTIILDDLQRNGPISKAMSGTFGMGRKAFS